MGKIFFIVGVLMVVVGIVIIFSPLGPPKPEGLCSADNWCWKNPVPWGNAFRCIQFVDEQQGFIIGFKSHLWRTADGGETWEVTQPVVSGIEYDPCVPRWYYDSWDLKDMHFITQNAGWAVGNKGVILKTGDGSRTWNLQHGLSHGTPGDTERDPDLNAIFMHNELKGWAVGRKRHGVILHTVDGGNSWEEIVFSTIDSLSDVFFHNDGMHGWAVGKEGAILHTTNGGLSWEIQNSGTNSNLNAVTFIDEQTGWAVGGGIILQTSDSGNSWVVQEEGDWWLYSVAFRDDGVGLSVGDNGVILLFITNNWVQAGTDAFPTRGTFEPRIYHVSFQDSIAWAVGSGGCILHSEDSGLHWSEKGSIGRLDQFRKVIVDGSNSAWIVSLFALLHTSDDGQTWSEHFPLQDFECRQATYNSISFAAGWGWVVCECIDSEGIAVSMILRTTNGGETWSELYSSSELNLEHIVFLDRVCGWIVGRSSDGQTVILKGRGGGEVWEEQYRGDFPYYPGHLSLLFVSRTTGWIVSSYADRFLYTIDGGESWQEQQIPGLTQINIAYFLSSRKGWAFGVDRETGFSGSLYHTIDGGQAWEKINYNLIFTPGTSECFPFSETSMIFTDEDTGWICGYYGEILHTTDGGQIWVHHESGTRHNLHSIDAYSGAGPVWVAGDEGTILRYRE